VYEIPQAARNAKGRAIINFIELEADEKIAAITPVDKVEAGKFVTTITRGGQIKKTELVEYENFRDKGIIGVRIADDDQLFTAIVTDGTAEFFVATKNGISIRFDEEQVRATGRATAGVKAIELDDGDGVVGLARTDAERKFVLAICERGYGKRTPIEEFRIQNRGGKGIILIDASDRNGPVVGIAMVKPEDEVMIITDRGQTIRTPIEGIRETGRNAQGVKVMRIEDDERVVAIEPINEGQNEDGQNDPPLEGESDEGSEAAAPNDSEAGPTEGVDQDSDDGGQEGA
jgi:DNA gyrase subunit A